MLVHILNSKTSINKSYNGTFWLRNIVTEMRAKIVKN